MIAEMGFGLGTTYMPSLVMTHTVSVLQYLLSVKDYETERKTKVDIECEQENMSAALISTFFFF